MQYIKFTHIDAKTNIPATDAPMRHGPKMPEVEGLVFSFAEESKYPTPAPTMYGTCPADADTSKPGVQAVLTEDEYQQALQAELDARKAKDRKQVDAIRDRHLFKNIPYTFPGDTEPDAIQLRDERDRQNIQDNMIDAQSKDPDAVMYFMPLSNQVKALTATQMLDMGAFLKSRGDAIYGAAWQKKGEVDAAGTFDELRNVDLQAGWPE